MESLIIVLLSVVLIGEIFAIVVKTKSLIIVLGDLGDPIVRVPENTVLIITKHKKVIKIFFAISDDMFRNLSEKIKKKLEKDIKYVRIKEGESGLKFIGFSIFGYDVHEWYETEEDGRDRINALHSIDLAEQVIKYLPEEPKRKIENDKIVAIENSEHDSINGVPSYKSADNIEIRTALTVFFVVVDPEKASFNIRYRKKAIKELIFPIWRDTLGKFSFFVYENIEKAKKETDITITPNIKTESNKLLLKKVGLNPDENNKIIKGIAKEVFLEKYGMRITNITVTELESSDPVLEEALASQMKARTKALAKIETAKGIEESLKREGAGEEAFIDQFISGFIGDDETKRSEAIQAVSDLLKVREIAKMPAEGRIGYQIPNIQPSSLQSPSLEKLLKGLDLGALKKIIESFKS